MMDLSGADPALCCCKCGRDIERLSLGVVTSYYRDVTIDIVLMEQTVMTDFFFQMHATSTIVKV